MKLAGEYLFDAEPQEVWDALFDTDILAAALPGCEKLALVDGQLHGDLNVKIGPISGKFTGKVALEDQVPPVSYRMIIDGKGPHGFVKASARIELAAEGERTRMRYDADAQVGGKIATVGQRLIETSAKAITKQSLEGLHENIKIRSAHHRAIRAEHLVALVPLPPDPEPATVMLAPPDSVPIPPVQVAVPVAAVPVAAALPEPEPESGPVSESEPGPVSESGPASESVPASVPAPAAVPPSPFAQSAQSKGPALPAPTYKRADPAKLASRVTKEVMRVMLPWILVALLSLALIISLATR